MQWNTNYRGICVFVEIKFERRETKYKKGQTDRQGVHFPLSTHRLKLQASYQQSISNYSEIPFGKREYRWRIVYLFLYEIVSLCCLWCETYLQSVVIVWGRPWNWGTRQVEKRSNQSTISCQPTSTVDICKEYIQLSQLQNNHVRIPSSRIHQMVWVNTKSPSLAVVVSSLIIMYLERIDRRRCWEVVFNRTICITYVDGTIRSYHRRCLP
jgi:hypothetical protein